MTHKPATPTTPADAMAVDGKTLRGSKKQGALGAHVLSVVSHRLGLTLTQQAVDAKTNEIKGIETVLAQLAGYSASVCARASCCHEENGEGTR